MLEFFHIYWDCELLGCSISLSSMCLSTVIAKHMRWGRQEDAHEFLRYVVDAMQRSCLAGQSNRYITYCPLDTRILSCSIFCNFQVYNQCHFQSYRLGMKFMILVVWGSAIKKLKINKTFLFSLVSCTMYIRWSSVNFYASYLKDTITYSMTKSVEIVLLPVWYMVWGGGGLLKSSGAWLRWNLFLRCANTSASGALANSNLKFC